MTAGEMVRDLPAPPEDSDRISALDFADLLQHARQKYGKKHPATKLVECLLVYESALEETFARAVGEGYDAGFKCGLTKSDKSLVEIAGEWQEREAAASIDREVWRAKALGLGGQLERLDERVRIAESTPSGRLMAAISPICDELSADLDRPEISLDDQERELLDAWVEMPLGFTGETLAAPPLEALAEEIAHRVMSITDDVDRGTDLRIIRGGWPLGKKSGQKVLSEVREVLQRRPFAIDEASGADNIRALATVTPQTYGEAVELYPWLAEIPSHEWDNRTTPENAAWIIGELKRRLVLESPAPAACLPDDLAVGLKKLAALAPKTTPSPGPPLNTKDAAHAVAFLYRAATIRTESEVIERSMAAVRAWLNSTEPHAKAAGWVRDLRERFDIAFPLRALDFAMPDDYAAAFNAWDADPSEENIEQVRIALCTPWPAVAKVTAPLLAIIRSKDYHIERLRRERDDARDEAVEACCRWFKERYNLAGAGRLRGLLLSAHARGEIFAGEAEGGTEPDLSGTLAESLAEQIADLEDEVRDALGRLIARVDNLESAMGDVAAFEAPEAQPRTAEAARVLERVLREGCRAGKDGDCRWEGCPQERDGEPARSGRHCPYDTLDPEPEEAGCLVEICTAQLYGPDLEPPATERQAGAASVQLLEAWGQLWDALSYWRPWSKHCRLSGDNERKAARTLLDAMDAVEGAGMFGPDPQTDPAGQAPTPADTDGW